MKNRTTKSPKHTVPLPTKIFVDGAGCKPDGKGSGFAICCPDTGAKETRYLDGLTNNQAEYRGLIAALEQLPAAATAEIYSDSLLMCAQFNGGFRVKDAVLKDLLKQVRAIISQKDLSVRLQWIPRTQNLAGKLL